MGWLAILGVPPFSGYWSKDKIIEAAFSADSFGSNIALWAGWVYGPIAMIGAGIYVLHVAPLLR